MQGWILFLHLLRYPSFVMLVPLQEDSVMRKHKHLSIEERSVIKSMLDQSASFKAIARALGPVSYTPFDRHIKRMV